LPAGFLAVHPGSGSPAKNWPFDRFVETARRLSPGRPWLLVLGPAEDAAAPPAGAIVARGLPLRRLAAVLARAGRFLGNDSGVSHLAAACGTRTLALFGPTDPAQWAPVGQSVRTLRAASGRPGDLAVDDVVEVAARSGSE
jgi:ADP-heptose:LPS heptosyltransferase